MSPKWGGVRTKAEQRVDALVREKRQLLRLGALSEADRDRVARISVIEFPKAWRAVHMAREPR